MIVIAMVVVKAVAVAVADSEMFCQQFQPAFHSWLFIRMQKKKRNEIKLR